MATNVTVFAVDGPVVIYFQDGSSTSITAQETKQFQLIEGGFCSISDSPAELDSESGEHMPPGTALAEAMIAFWDRMREKFRTAAREQPTVNPVEVEVE